MVSTVTGETGSQPRLPDVTVPRGHPCGHVQLGTSVRAHPGHFAQRAAGRGASRQPGQTAATAGRSRPRSMAQVAIWTRESSTSRARMCLTWLAAVPSVMTRVAAIWRFVIP